MILFYQERKNKLENMEEIDEKSFSSPDQDIKRIVGIK